MQMRYLSRNATGRQFQRHGPATEKLLSLRRIHDGTNNNVHGAVIMT